MSVLINSRTNKQCFIPALQVLTVLEQYFMNESQPDICRNVSSCAYLSISLIHSPFFLNHITFTFSCVALLIFVTPTNTGLYYLIILI